MKKNLTAIIISILCFIAAARLIFPPACKGIVDAIWLISFGLPAILVLTIVIVINVYRIIKNGENFNLTPIVSFLISIGLIAIIVCLNSERFKSKRILAATSENYHLVLRENKDYELTRKEADYGCTEEGTYKIFNDTIILAEQPAINKTLYVNEKYLIVREDRIIKQIYKDSVDSNKDNYLIINEIYAP